MMKIAMIALALIVPAAAQELKLPANLDRLAAKAVEVVDVTLDANMLQMASRFLSVKDAGDAEVKKMVSGLKGVYVKSFTFEKPGEYLESDVESVRSQLRGPGWTRIVGVRSRKDGENAEVFIRSEAGKIAGLAIVAAEPKELTIVHISGSITPEQIGQLSGHFGIPKIKGADSKSGKQVQKDED
jgi:hypothetical protein